MNWLYPDPRLRAWFTADTHFQHRMLIDRLMRPFDTTDSMDRTMIRRWNDVVGPDDIVYHLGDFAMGIPDTWSSICRQLNGFKVLIRGNHDRSAAFMQSIGFDVVTRNAIVTVDDQRLWLHHYPHRQDSSPGPRRPSAPGPFDLALCGHVHDAWQMSDGIVNVGQDVWDFTPVDLTNIRRRASA